MKVPSKDVVRRNWNAGTVDPPLRSPASQILFQKYIASPIVARVITTVGIVIINASYQALVADPILVTLSRLTKCADSHHRLW